MDAWRIRASSGTLALPNLGGALELATHEGEVVDTVEWGTLTGFEQSLVRFPEGVGAFALHRDVGPDLPWSPGARSDGTPFGGPQGLGAAVVINEILVAPSAWRVNGDASCDRVFDPRGDEFVEVLNGGEQPVSLAGWVLREGGTGEVRHLFSGSTLLEPGQAVVVIGGDPPRCNTGKTAALEALPTATLLGREGSYLASRVSLGSDLSGDQIADLAVSESAAAMEDPRLWLVSHPAVPEQPVEDVAFADLRQVEGVYIGLEPYHAGDVDGDGWDDLWVWTTCRTGCENTAYLLSGPLGGTLDLGPDLATAWVEGVQAMAAGDLTGDGWEDALLWHGSEALDVVPGPFVGPVDLELDPVVRLEPTCPESPEVAGLRGAPTASGDLDGDGADDLLFTRLHAGGGGVVLAYSGPLATGTWVQEESADLVLFGDETESYPQSVAVGDADGDGHLDLLVGASGARSIGTRRNHGAAYLFYGRFWGSAPLSAAETLIAGEPGAASNVGSTVDLPDLDADGRAEVLVSSGKRTHLWVGPLYGAVGFTSAPWQIEEDELAGAADIDGDGRDDLVFVLHGDDRGGENAGAVEILYASSWW